jgi:hypothetical protein
MQISQLSHRFVQYIPDDVESGVLYISMEYATAVHSCCCGCGEEVVTPFAPTDWLIIFDGEAVSLRPSVGNWNQACRSHYFISRGQVVEAAPWSQREVNAERERARAAKTHEFEKSAGQSANPIEESESAPTKIVRLIRYIRGWFE